MTESKEGERETKAQGVPDSPSPNHTPSCPQSYDAPLGDQSTCEDSRGCNSSPDWLVALP
eukprot:8997395-Prorocentrum_lima.AAC.1